MCKQGDVDPVLRTANCAAHLVIEEEQAVVSLLILSCSQHHKNCSNAVQMGPRGLAAVQMQRQWLGEWQYDRMVFGTIVYPSPVA